MLALYIDQFSLLTQVVIELQTADDANFVLYFGNKSSQADNHDGLIFRMKP